MHQGQPQEFDHVRGSNTLQNKIGEFADCHFNETQLNRACAERRNWCCTIEIGGLVLCRSFSFTSR